MLLLLPLAVAFEPPDHRAMAERALVLERPAGELLPPDDAEAARMFARGAAGEDWNLPRKWTRWHHYDPPGFEVHPLGRSTSAERVARLEVDIEEALRASDPDAAWLLAGFAAHHLQDMASPLHVVPVSHGLGDPFEGYPFGPLVADAGAAPVPEGTPRVVQRGLALATLAALDEPLACADGPLPWTRFWVPRDHTFGRYGDLAFGRVPGCEAGTEDFARARIEAAIAATRSVLRYVRALARSLPGAVDLYAP